MGHHHFRISHDLTLTTLTTLNQTSLLDCPPGISRIYSILLNPNELSWSERNISPSNGVNIGQERLWKWEIYIYLEGETDIYVKDKIIEYVFFTHVTPKYLEWVKQTFKGRNQKKIGTEAKAEFYLLYRQARWLKLSRMTGCVPRCSVHSFSFVEKTSSEANWGRNWSKSTLSSLSPASPLS